MKKTALIIGGNSGLGLATAHKLAKEGFNLCIVYRDRKSNAIKNEAYFDEMRSHGVNVDTFNKDALKEENINEMLSKLSDKSISVLVHSIAKGSLKPLVSSSRVLGMDDLEITIHAMGTNWWQWVRACIANNIFAKNVSNIAFTSEGNQKVWESYGAVSAAKATLESLMRQMAVELAPLGVKSNCVQAGVTQTASFDMIPDSEKLAELAKKRNPFLRLTQPEDVANAVYLLTLPESNWINGNVIKVDGGESLR
ncbi:oxidoreductase, short chain dehydrogenase/reductase family protein [unidentified eubacterium SCB49]|nr:oxidoreductase, short chain dehydrogenase/reductase family protein [unidentified eubacterium SCB49]